MDRQSKKTSNHLTGYAAIFSENDWNELDFIVANIFTHAPDILETPKFGDSRNEQVDLYVARFIVRENGCSQIVNESHSREILRIFTRANFIERVEQYTRLKKLKILRMQLNSMEKGSFVSVHTDCENDPAYEVTVLIRTTSFYLGGELRLYADKLHIINQKNHSVFVMDPAMEHEVSMVLHGCRNSLIVVLGKE